jgi:hypothetical protein
MLESEMKLKRSGFGSFPDPAQRIPETKFKKCLFKQENSWSFQKKMYLLYNIKKDKFVQIYSLLLKRIRPDLGSKFNSRAGTSYLTF